MNKKLAIISVVFENYEVLKDFFKTLEEQTEKNFHLFLIDLSLNKKTIPKTKFPLTVINGKNLGYSYGVNLGLKRAIKENFLYFCVVNSDVYFKKDFIGQVLQSLKKHSSSIIGGKIYYAFGFEYHKNRYQKKELGKVFWYAGGRFDWDNVLTVHRGVDEVDQGQYNREEKTDFITGCLMAFDKKVIEKVGFWDESYFLYFEDADFCWRAKKKDILLYYNPKIVIWHKNAQSTGGSGSLLHQKYQNKNRIKFGLKYAPFKTKFHLIKELIFRKKIFKEFIFLLFIFLFTFLARSYLLSDNLFYAYEQGRDLLVVKKIVEDKKFTLIGPRTSVDGIFHGPIYYYWMALGYFLGKGNPIFIILFFILWQSFGVIFFYFFLKELFNKQIAFWGSLFYAVSYGLVVYSRWFSHPPLIIPFSILYFYSLYKIARGNNLFYLPLTLFWGIIFQLDLVVAIFFVPTTIIFFVWQKLKIPNFLIIFKSLIISLLVFSSYLIFDFRHQFLMFNSLKKFIFSNKISTANSLFVKASTTIIDRYIIEYRDIISPNISSFLFFIFFIFLLLSFLKQRKTVGEKILLIWLISLPTFGMFFSPLFGLKHYLVGLGPAIITFLVWFIFNFLNFEFLPQILLSLIILNNLFLIKNWLPENKNIFYLSTSSGKMILKNQLDVLNYIYQSREGKIFSYEAFTVPYWCQDGWRYLFSWYGKKKYGFIPEEGKEKDLFYVIIEPGGDKSYLNNWLKERFEGKTVLLEKKFFNGIEVQKRININAEKNY